MEKLSYLEAVAAPIPADNLDTDQLMPKQFLRGIDKSGLDKGLLYNMRMNPDGTPNKDFVFNKPGFEDVKIIAAGPNFGCGSSREHAVWGLLQYGIRAVIAPGFGEIFYSNCFNNGLLAAKVTPEASLEILDALSADEPRRLAIDAAACTIACMDGPATGRTWTFEIGRRHQTMILEGLDMLESTLRDMPEIDAFKRRHEAAFPWMAELPGRMKALRGR